jgi:phage gp16-like protein
MQPAKSRDAQRRALMGVVHKAAKAIQLDDDDRRAMQLRITGKESLAEMNLSQIGDVLDELRALGWVDGKRSKGRRRLASHPEAAKIRALWLSLYHLGEVTDPTEDALAAFVKRQTRLDDLEWVKQENALKVIEALKSWCDRAGYYLPDADRKRRFNLSRQRAGKEPANDGLCCKFVLIYRLWQLLADHGAFRHGTMARLDTWLVKGTGVVEPYYLTAQQADERIERLGQWLRRHKKAPEHE